jgi:tellurite resistance protein
MLDQDTLKAIFQNALLMAFADGALHPLQREFLKDLVEHAGVDLETAKEWRAELESGTLAFRPVRDRKAAVEVARVAIGAAAANGVFHQKEKLALLELGKAVGLDRDELQRLVHESFGKDVLREVFTKAPAPGEFESEAGAWVITDDFPALEAFLASAAGLSPRTTTAREALAAPSFSGLLFFHTRETTAQSQGRLDALRRRHPGARIVFVAERAQAFQIGYLLDGGAAGCLIAPVYPDEIEGLLARLERPRA